MYLEKKKENTKLNMVFPNMLRPPQCRRTVIYYVKLKEEFQVKSRNSLFINEVLGKHKASVVRLGAKGSVK